MENKIFLNGVEVEKIPPDALAIMSKRLSIVVSQYFSEHPDEYAAFMAEQQAGIHKKTAARE